MKAHLVSLSLVTSLADGMYLDFRFHRDGQTWLLTEEGFLPGLGMQKHVLVPVPDGPSVADDERHSRTFN